MFCSDMWRLYLRMFFFTYFLFIFELYLTFFNLSISIPPVIIYYEILIDSEIVT